MNELECVLAYIYILILWSAGGRARHTGFLQCHGDSNPDMIQAVPGDQLHSQRESVPGQVRHGDGSGRMLRDIKYGDLRRAEKTQHVFIVPRRRCENRRHEHDRVLIVEQLVEFCDQQRAHVCIHFVHPGHFVR